MMALGHAGIPARMNRTSMTRNENGRIPIGLVLVLLTIFLLLPAGCVAYKMSDGAAPTVKIKIGAKAIGKKARITIEADEPRYGVRDLRATLEQGAVSVPLGEMTNPKNPWWRFWRREVRPSALLELEIGRDRVPELKEGQATIRAEATNDSWARFGKGRTTLAQSVVPILIAPPRIEAVSSQHYINQGGSECAVYRVSNSAEVSGVRVGSYFFPGYALPGGSPDSRFAIFAFPYDLPASTVPLLVAQDAAGNEATAPLTFKFFPKTFRRETLPITDAFMGRVVPEILNQSRMASQGDLLKDFLEVNGRLRRINGAMLVELAGETKPVPLWKGAFVQLGNSKVEASFADHRSYEYQGRVVDEQDHLGFDLAVTASHPVGAANNGVVALAKFFGIYGNTVVIDHGCGLMTLYAHLSAINVKKGQSVARGEVVGKSGATGLAGGDHLHFSVLLQGIPVNPVEWWDPHWIHDRIELKIGPRT